MWEIWREFCGIFQTHKTNAEKFRGNFRSIFREKIRSPGKIFRFAARHRKGFHSGPTKVPIKTPTEMPTKTPVKPSPPPLRHPVRRSLCGRLTRGGEGQGAS